MDIDQPYFQALVDQGGGSSPELILVSNECHEHADGHVSPQDVQRTDPEDDDVLKGEHPSVNQVLEQVIPARANLCIEGLCLAVLPDFPACEFPSKILDWQYRPDRFHEDRIGLCRT